MRTATLLAVTLLAGQLTAAEVSYKKAPTPADAAAYAASDLASVPFNDQKFQRYVWFPEPSKEKVAGLVYTLNSLSSASTQYRPVVLHRGALVRLDLRRIAPFEEDFNRVRDVWEELAATNFYFNTIRPVTKEIIEEVPQPPKKEVQRRVVNGYWQNVTVEVPQPPLKKVTTQLVTVAEFSIHTNLENILLLHTLSGESRAPIVNGDQFMITALTTLDGGLYYRFLGIEPSTVSGKTDLDVFLEKYGASESDIERLRSDQRIAMFRSGVTGKPRRIRFWNGGGVRPTVGTGLITITDDFKESNLDPKQHPIKSVASKKADAHEVIVMARNGSQVYAIFDGDGKLANEVPEDIALDHTIPAPNTKRLEPGLSCISCHGPADGYLPARNDVQRLVKAFKVGPGYTGAQIFDDEQSNENVLETIDRVSGWFTGDAERTAFRQARNDHQRAVFGPTGGVGVQAATAAIRNNRDKYRYGLITPMVACREMGYVVENEVAAAKLFNEVLPFTPSNSFGVHLEDPVIAALRAYDPVEPIEILRREWEPIYSDVMLRVKTKTVADLLTAPGKGQKP